MDKTERIMLHNMPSFKLKLYVFLKSLIFPFSNIEKIIPKGNIVEIGCSYGLTSAYLCMKGRIVTGFDIDDERIKLAKKIWKLPNIRFKVASLLETVAIKKNQILLAVDLLHHVPLEQQKIFFHKCYKRFDKTNVLIIKEIDKKPAIKFWLNYLGDLIMNPGDYYFQSSKNLKKKLEKVGFDVGFREIKHPLYPHYVLICRKR